jgi:late competence protein required for DNA uptake (superfamily II DNA/RNA helicase)
MCSEPYEEHLFRCDRCNNDFIKEEMVDEDGLLYCKSCFCILLEGGEI